uniref:D-serine dehydratase-like domain-containing protein n=1 Tax=Emiliania huxleyi (strain CCMP1516) TaxID=280463 RepID=A0A0D3I343_EMIH1
MERDVTTRFAESLRAAGIEVPSIGVGSTPTCSVPPPHLAGVDEWHPGNFFAGAEARRRPVYSENEPPPFRWLLNQVLTRVVGHYPKSNTLLIDCGWTGASAQGKESGTAACRDLGQSRESGYGCFPLNPELRIANLKQECGEVTSVDGAPLDFRRYPIGALLRIAPHHSCASTHQHRSVNVLGADGDTVVEEWKICKGW